MTRYLLLGSLAWFVVATASALALECPVPSEIDNPATASLVQKFLPADIDLAAPDAMESAIFELKRAGVAPDVILDNLIAVRCAAIAVQPNLSDDDKAKRVEAFSQTATQLVFDNSN